MALLLLALLFAQNPDSAPDNHEDRAKQRRSDFVFKGVSVIQNHGDGMHYSSSATSIRSAKRTGAGGLIVYNDIGEIIASNVMIETTTNREQGTPLADVFDAAKNFFWVNGRNSTLELMSPRDPMFMTRVRIEKLSMRIHDLGGVDLSLKALKARLIFDPETLVLEGQVVIDTRPGDEIRSLRAVFSAALDGVYFPDGCTLGDRRYAHSAFLVLASDGKFVETPIVDQINYNDYIAKMENLVLAQLLRTLPRGVRPLMGTVLGHPGAGRK
jgi:hypothetical protein